MKQKFNLTLFSNKVRALFKQRKVLVLAVALPLVGLFVFVAFRTGPLAKIPVTVIEVAEQKITPAIFGVGTVEARSVFKIGPNTPGRVRKVFVHVGDNVKYRQLLAEMERPDLDLLDSADAERNYIERSLKQEEMDARKRVEAAEERLHTLEESSGTALDTEKNIARENLRVAREDLARVSGSAKNPLRVSANLRLLSPVKGIVTQRNAEPGTTVVQGQSVVEVIDPQSLWLNVRLDQSSTAGLRSGLKAKILLRSRKEPLAGYVLRIEPLADAVTEETVVKVAFEKLPSPLPPLGELAEVTLDLPPLAAKPTVPNASLVRISGELGVWALDTNSTKIRFVPVKIGASDLEGNVQILEGLDATTRVIVYSKAPLTPHSRIQIVDRLIGVGR